MVHSIPGSSYAYYTTATPATTNHSNMMTANYPTTYYSYKPMPVQSEYDDNNMHPRKLRRYSSPMPLTSTVNNTLPYSSTSNSASYSGRAWLSMTPTQSNSNLSTYGKPQNKELKRNYFSNSNPFALNLDLQKTDLHSITNRNAFEVDNSFEDCPDSGDLSPPSSPLHGGSSGNGINKSAIECGSLDNNGNRIFTIDSDYFEKNVEIYVAASDPQRRVLYRASALAEKFGCATNKVGMYLSRRRNSEEGLYQASGFLYKPPGRSGLKSGGYFLSMEVCQGFEHHYCRQNHRQKIRQLRRQQTIANVRADTALSSNNSESASIDSKRSVIEESSKAMVESQYSNKVRSEFNDLSDCSSSSADNTPLQSPVSPDSSLSMSYPMSVPTLSNVSVHLPEQQFYSYPQLQQSEQPSFSYSEPSTFNCSYCPPQAQVQCLSSDLLETADYNQFNSVSRDFVPYEPTNVKMEDANTTYFDEFSSQMHPNLMSSNDSDYIFGILY